MKKLLKKLVCSFASLFMLFSATPVMASENTPIDDAVIIDTLAGKVNESYVIDENGNQLGSLSTEVASVEVVYDGAWSGMRAVNVPRTINVSVICRGTGVFADPMYNCTLFISAVISKDYKLKSLQFSSIDILEENEWYVLHEEIMKQVKPLIEQKLSENPNRNAVEDFIRGQIRRRVLSATDIKPVTTLHIHWEEDEEKAENKPEDTEQEQ